MLREYGGNVHKTFCHIYLDSSVVLVVVIFYSLRTSKQDALVVQGVAPALPREGALEPGQVVVGRLAHYVTVELAFR